MQCGTTQRDELHSHLVEKAMCLLGASIPEAERIAAFLEVGMTGGREGFDPRALLGGVSDATLERMKTEISSDFVLYPFINIEAARRIGAIAEWRAFWSADDSMKLEFVPSASIDYITLDALSERSKASSDDHT